MAATDAKITHPDDMVEFGEYRITLKNGDKFSARFIKFARRSLNGKTALHLSFDSLKDHRAWFVQWEAIQQIRLIELPDEYYEERKKYAE